MHGFLAQVLIFAIIFGPILLCVALILHGRSKFIHYKTHWIGTLARSLNGTVFGDTIEFEAAGVAFTIAFANGHGPSRHSGLQLGAAVMLMSQGKLRDLEKVRQPLAECEFSQIETVGDRTIARKTPFSMDQQSLNDLQIQIPRAASILAEELRK